MRRSTPAQWLLTGLTSLAFGTQVYAQDAGSDVSDDSEYMLEEVIVTATKFNTSLMDTPLAVSAFEEDYLNKLGIRNVRELVNVVPNMSIMTDVESMAPIVTLRGVRSTNTTEWGDPAVGIHYDGIYSPRPQGALALMFDVERVEVLRGPQGTLYGRNSTVGTVNIISKKPDFEEFSGSAEIEVGRWSQRAFKGVVNIPLADNFGIRAAVFAEERDSNMKGYYDPNQWDQRYLGLDEGDLTPTDTAMTPAGNNGDFNTFFRDQLYEEIPADESTFYNNIDQWGARISAYWKPTDKIAWAASFERFRDKSAGGMNARDCDRIKDRPADINGGSCEDIWGNNNNFVGFVNVPGKNDMTIDSLRSHFVWDFTDNVEFAYNYGYQNQERVGQIDLDQGYYFWDQMLKWVDTDYSSYSHEVQFKSTGEGRLQWVAGYFNFKEENYMLGQYHGAMGGVSLWNQPDREIKSEAIFGQGTYELTDKLYLTLGARYTEDTKEDKGGRNMGCWGQPCYPEAWAMVRWDLIDWGAWPNGNEAFYETSTIPRDTLNRLGPDYYDYPNELFKTDTNNDVKDDWSKTTWRIGLDYDFSEDIMMYGYVANGYKAGGIGDVIFKQSDGSRFDTSYDEEEVITYEVGVKARLLDGAMNLRANFFYSDYEGQQFTAWTIYDVYEVEIVDPETGEEITVEEDLGTFLTRNASNSRIMGLELEAEWNAWENGFIGGYFTTLDTEITSDYWKAWGTEPGQVFNGYYAGPLEEDKAWFRNLKGNDLPYSPDYSFTLNISHDFVFDNGATLTPFLNIHWESSSYVSIDNTDKWEFEEGDLQEIHDIDIYSDKRDSWAMATFNLNYTSADGVWYAEGYVYNLTDEDVNWWQGYAGSTPMANKAQRSYGVRFGFSF
jgi:iron complex outermembrane receptor protein